MQARQPHTSTRKGLASYLFFWVESGSGVLEYEGARHELHAGDCVFLDCQRPYQHHTGDDLCSCTGCIFMAEHGGHLQKVSGAGRPALLPRC